jgi:eukaryotic-like serine/threonine-protein kinase
VTQVGEGRGAVSGGPVAGEILAERYQLEQHINTDSTGRQVWYGIDIILRRPVAIVIRYPGGTAAAQMMQTAVRASRIVHPNLVGVYDAIDEHSRAYVVREWVHGASLRDHISGGPFDGERAIAVAHATAAAVTAVHASGMTHGNVHPGTVLIGHDGRVVLADAYGDGVVSGEEDIRAAGGVLYYALTGYWPHGEVAGPADLPDGMRDATGAIASPRQVRAGVPDHLDSITMDLLDRRLPVPPAEMLTAEFARFDTGPEEPYDNGPDTGPVRLRDPDPSISTPPSGRKVMLGVGALVVVGILGLLVGLNVLASPSDRTGAGGPGTDPPATVSPTTPASSPTIIALTPNQVRIVDPGGNRAELGGVEALVDSDTGTAWRTDQYRGDRRFGLLKPGMGILINLGEERSLASVKVEMSTSGAVADLRVGTSDPGDSTAGDEQILDTYTPLGEPQSEGSTMVFSSFDPDTSYQYLMIWFTELPSDGEHFRLEVLQVTVEGY